MGTIVTMDKILVYLILFTFSMVNCVPKQLPPRRGLFKSRFKLVRERIMAKLGSDTDTCYVNEEASQKKEPCFFPFRYKGKMHYGCTTDGFDSDEIPYPWCSTKISAIDSMPHGNEIETLLDHVSGQGFYGKCESKKCKMTDDMDSLMEIEEWLFFPLQNTLS